MDVVITIIVGIVALVIGLISGFFALRMRTWRSDANADTSAESVVLQACEEAQRLLGRAEDEGRAKAEAYREREEAALEHRRLELKSSEGRLNQRETDIGTTGGATSPNVSRC